MSRLTPDAGLELQSEFERQRPGAADPFTLAAGTSLITISYTLEGGLG